MIILSLFVFQSQFNKRDGQLMSKQCKMISNGLKFFKLMRVRGKKGDDFGEKDE